MQLERLATTPSPRVQDPGTPAPVPGVVTADAPPSGEATARAPAGRDAAVRGWQVLLLVLACLSLLGQGERSRVDMRFISPSATLHAYWDALRAGDADAARECLVEGHHQRLLPGMLWFLPPTDELTLQDFRSLPVTGGRILVSYEVQYLPTGSDELHSFRTSEELIRTRGEWRIARPVGEVSVPEWTPASRQFDS